MIGFHRKQNPIMNTRKNSAHNTHQECPIARVVALLGDTWSLLIVRDLLSGPKRFGALLESLHGISSRTLTNKLKHLETEHVIERQEFRERPPRVEYQLTKKGLDLHNITQAMRQFGEKYPSL